MSIITNPFIGPQEGFGEQYKLILYYAIYAELNQLKFVYTPFIKIAHNYLNESNFEDKLDKFIGIKEELPLINSIDKNKLIEPFISDVLFYLHNHMNEFENSKTLTLIKKCFYRKNKKPHGTGGIGIHIRRQNPDDNNTHSGLFVPNELYIYLIQKMIELYPNYKIHIFSQGTMDQFKLFEQIFGFQKLQLHLNESLETTFVQLVYADVLIIAPSALSYMAGCLSNGKIFYMSHCNPKLPKWNLIEGYESPRKYHKFRYEATVYFDSKTNEYILKKSEFPFETLKVL